MTKEQFDRKYQELIAQLPELLQKRADELWQSGGVDTSKYEDDFELPKIILCASAEEIDRACRPLSSVGKKILSNLKHF